MGAVHASVQDIFYFIQDETPGSIPGCVTKPRYIGGPLMHCPVLDAMNDSSADPRYQALRNALLENDCHTTFKIIPVQPELRDWTRLYDSSFKTENFQLEAQPPRDRRQGSTEDIVVKLVSNDKDAEVRSMRFSAYLPGDWEKSKPRFGIDIECKHWITAVKMNVLMINLFKLDFNENEHTSDSLNLHPEDREQFIDMVQLLLHPHEIEATACRPFESLFVEVLLSAKTGPLREKGLKLYELRGGK